MSEGSSVCNAHKITKVISSCIVQDHEQREQEDCDEDWSLITGQSQIGHLQRITGFVVTCLHRQCTVMHE
jgi:hypothetical protein